VLFCPQPMSGFTEEASSRLERKIGYPLPERIRDLLARCSGFSAGGWNVFHDPTDRHPGRGGPRFVHRRRRGSPVRAADPRGGGRCVGGWRGRCALRGLIWEPAAQCRFARARGHQTVEPPAALAGFLHPATLDEPSLLQAVEQRVERGGVECRTPLERSSMSRAIS
jgi:hypothetical protein